MNIKNCKESQIFKPNISISLIKQIIEKLRTKDIKNNINSYIDNINIIEKLDIIFSKKEKQINLTLIKFTKFIHTFHKKFILKSKIINNNEIINKNKSISYISICYLKNNINEGNHNKIKNFLTLLLFLLSLGVFPVKDLIFILEIMLNSLIEIINTKSKDEFQIFDINKEPLLFIKDIIYSLINFPINIIKNYDFIEKLMRIFNKFIDKLEKLNIIIKLDCIWLKLLENKSVEDSFELLEDESYNNSIKKIRDLIVNIYKKNIPENIYDEIYNKSCIDLLYYLNIINLLKDLFKNEFKKSKKLNIEKAVYLLKNNFIKYNINFSSNDFSLVLCFNLIKKDKEESSNIIKLYTKEKEKINNIINVLINIDDVLCLDINNDFKWNTSIKINKNIFHFVCITFNKKTKILKLYIDSGENTNIIIKEKKTGNYPKFIKDMNLCIGGKNIEVIFSDIFLLQKELNKDSVKYLFESKGYNPNLMIRNDININLIKEIKCSKNYKDIKNHFKLLKYEYIHLFSPNSLLYYEKIVKKNPFEEFIDLKGIEFLTFMLHVLDSRVNDVKYFNIFLYQILDFLNTILNFDNDLQLLYQYKNIDYIYEIDINVFKNQINIFFLTLFNILKNGNIDKKKYYKKLSEQIFNTLMNIFSLDLENSIIFKQIILSILFDYELFEQKKYISSINESIDKIKTSEFNNELYYKIFLLDFIFESNIINHKNYLNLLGSFLEKKNAEFCDILIKYIFELENENKLYHYMKIIYRHINKIKSILASNIYNLYEFVERKFETINYTRCKYSSYIIILCYLIKEEIITEDKNRRDVFTFKKYYYMANPSYLFIRCIFIENFNLKNMQKLKFIKSKGKTKFNFDIFSLVKFHPFELYDIDKFLVRFDSILNYINYLLSLKIDDNLKNIFEYFFPFILEFVNCIKKNYAINIFIKVDDEEYFNEFYSSEEFKKFFIMYIKYDKEKALVELKSQIKSSFFTVSNPFYFQLLSQKTMIVNKYRTILIKIEIIKLIIDIICNYIDELKPKALNNIFLFLLIVYQSNYRSNLNSKELPIYFINFYMYLSEQKLILFEGLFDLNYFEEEEEKEKKEKKNKIKKKYLCEILLDIILFFYEKGYYNNQMIKSLLIKKNATSLFYNTDFKYLCNGEKKTEINSKIIFNERIGDFSLCFYFLIYFLQKYNSFKEQSKKATILVISESIFNDICNLCSKNKKIFSKLKKVKDFGKNFDNYNLMLDIWNKHHKDANFNIEILMEKYNQLKNNENPKKIEKIIYDEIEINLEDNKKRSKSLDIKDPDEIKGKYFFKENKDNNSINNESIISIKYENIINDNNINEINEEDKENSSWGYIISEIEKIDIYNYYLNLIVNSKNANSEKIMSLMFNPKKYFCWNYFTIFFRNYLFYNKKFKALSKIFQIYENNFDKNNSKEKDVFLNYPSKIKNYITDQYYRPFLKPYLNFFDNKYINITHSYVNNKFLTEKIYKEENFYKIKYKTIIPDASTNNKYFCELIKNRGNIFGYIELNNKFILFKNSQKDDLSSSSNPEERIKYIYSITDDKIIDENKYVLIYYENIKEIIKRRVCLLYIAIEIFMKDNKSYMFNFFDKNILAQFFDDIKNFAQNKKNTIKISMTFREDIPKKRNMSFFVDNLKNTLSLNDSDDISFQLIEDPINYFKKLLPKIKSKKEYLSNFDYLLLINKYSSRTYNDSNQYLIFPLLFMDIESKRKRDLSKVICLNKENNEQSLEKYKTNYDYYGCHFNQHYSTGAFLYYFLVRLIPFTFQHIEFQAMSFDSPNRLFNSLNHSYSIYKITDDNRELIPEFYCSYDFLINLNYNDFGMIIKDDKRYLLNNVETFHKYSYPEFIIKSRINLESADISPWIDLIFGYKQDYFSEKEPNLFPIDSYEKNIGIEKIKQDNNKSSKEKIEEIKGKIEMLKFGMIPAKLFNKPQEKLGMQNSSNQNEDERNLFLKKHEKIKNVINNYIQKKIKEKNHFYIINKNNINEIEIIFKFNTKIDIFKLKLHETKGTEISLKIKEQIDLEPYNNSFCEILPHIYCFVRHFDNTFSFVSIKKIISVYQFNCMITSIEKLNSKKIEEEKNIINVFFGDEKGFLHLVEIKYELNQSDKTYDIKNVKIKNSVKTHKRLIKGLCYDERLNIIISWSDQYENFISINNDYSLDFLNIINIGENNDIKEILISKYDLIFISCYNDTSKSYKIFCYTLNGIQISCYENSKKIIKCFIDEKINIIHINNNIFSFYLYTFDEIYKSQYCEFIKDFQGLKLYIKECFYFPQIKTYLMFCNDNKIYFYQIEDGLI